MISEHAHIKELAQNVILHALSEFCFGDVVRYKVSPYRKVKLQLAAFEFLVSPEFQFWADVAGRDFDVREVFKNLQGVKQTLRENPKRSKRK